MSIKQAEKSAQTKHELEKAAIELFVEKGYEKTTIADIAKRSGYSVGAFYRHFPSKVDIITDLWVSHISSIVRNASRRARKCQTLDELFTYLLKSAKKMENDPLIRVLYSATRYVQDTSSIQVPTAIFDDYLQAVCGLIKKNAPHMSEENALLYSNMIIRLFGAYWSQSISYSFFSFDEETIMSVLYLVKESFRHDEGLSK